MKMVKTQVYLPAKDLDALREIARRKHRAIASLVREAVAEAYLRPPATGPVALWDGPFDGSSADHDAAFDEP